MIQIDTDVLKQLSVNAKSATDELITAGQILNQITTHNDWGCRERYTINEQILTIRKNMLRIGEYSNSFTNIITQVTDDFLIEEKKVAEMFEELESMIAGILSIVSPIATVTPDFSDIFIDTKVNEKIKKAAIQVIGFEDIVENLSNDNNPSHAFGEGTGGGGFR